MTDKIAVIASTENRQVPPSTWECFAFAQQLAQDVNATITLIFIGKKQMKSLAASVQKPDVKPLPWICPGLKDTMGNWFKKHWYGY